VSRGERESAIRAALVTSRKAQDRDRTLVLTTILSAIENRRIDAGRDLGDDDVAEVLRKGIKQRQEAAEQFQKGGRPELAQREAQQMKVIEEFLPAMASDDEIRTAVRAAIAGGAKELGRVMGQVLPAFKGRAEGRTINQIAREELSGG
jgi:uncharacterized protein YqeY